VLFSGCHNVSKAVNFVREKINKLNREYIIPNIFQYFLFSFGAEFFFGSVQDHHFVAYTVLLILNLTLNIIKFIYRFYSRKSN
jgi:hypothetical protein